MFYKFPFIESLNQVREVIKNSPEFAVVDKDGGYTVVNYKVAFEDTFPIVTTESDAIRRECRGLKFNTATGKVIARTLHKFFNVNEREETQINNIDFSQPHTILCKRDGSMITPIPTIAGIRWGTKMGVTDVALPVEEFIVSHPEYERLASDCIDLNCTLIFEWCSRKQRIVVDYPKDELVLLAIRHNITGNYMLYNELLEIGEKYSIPVIEQYTGSVTSMQDLVDKTRNETGNEGWIVRFDSGHMVKVKAEEYIAFHKTKAAIEQEKNVVKLILDEKVDDLKGMLLDEDREKVIKFEKEFWHGINISVIQLTTQFNTLHKKVTALEGREKRAEFAKCVNNSNLDAYYKRAMFQLLDGQLAIDVVKTIISGMVSTQTKLDQVRYLFGNAKWNYSLNE